MFIISLRIRRNVYEKRNFSLQKGITNDPILQKQINLKENGNATREIR